MKYFIMFLLIALCGCGSNASNKPFQYEQVKASDGDIINIVNIDGCQYFKLLTDMGYVVYCHKGNCTNHPSDK
jgi:hypothetical protein